MKLLLLQPLLLLINQVTNKTEKLVIPKGVPESTAKIAAFLNFNCDIRRHTAKNIIAAAKEAVLLNKMANAM